MIENHTSALIDYMTFLGFLSKGGFCHTQTGD